MALAEQTRVEPLWYFVHIDVATGARWLGGSETWWCDGNARGQQRLGGSETRWFSSNTRGQQRLGGSETRWGSGNASGQQSGEEEVIRGSEFIEEEEAYEKREGKNKGEEILHYALLALALALALAHLHLISQNKTLLCSDF